MDPASIELLEASKVQWRSGALGCPEPGMLYIQALVPGTLIILEFEEQRFRYHAGSNGHPYYCPQERAEDPVNDQDLELS